MTFLDLQQQAFKHYYPALVLERLRLAGQGRRAAQILRVAWGVILVLAVLAYGFSQANADSGLASYAPRLFGGFFVVFAVWLATAAIQAFYTSYYFRSMPENAKAEGEVPPMLFELARILYRSKANDPLRGFLESDEGFMTMMRSGIEPKDVREFLTKYTAIHSDSMMLPESRHVTASMYAAALYDSQKDFAQFLFVHSIQKKDFTSIVGWVVEREVAWQVRTRWWSREHLGRIPGLGKNWSYGQIYKLEQYAREIPAYEDEEYETHGVYGSAELKELESILAKRKEANALLIGNDTEGNLELVARLSRMIESGTVMPELEHKRLIMLDTDLITASVKSKPEFEVLFISILREAYNAGNVILVFADFPAFVSSVETFGSDLASLLDPYLASSELQIVALSDTDRFHAKIERNALFTERFEQVLVRDIDRENTIHVLENEIVDLEARTKLFFTYPALQTIAESAERYFPDAILPDKAIDLLLEIAPAFTSRGARIVRKEDVLELVKTKTGIPVGKVTEEERTKLLSLEDILHHRIIGQDEAVVSISNAVRRSRSGINNPNRPLASFLFLGPTGVGKTETTKALGEVFFGKEAHILRLDMSEYSTADALSKLIGSFEGGKTGVLSSMLREHPYGVLLLDEFEKTTPEVMNLFLQILDEGFFSDMEGKKVNARNLLIIATSNAGSELIWDAVKHGDDLSHAKELIIDSIIKAHLFKPELLNRFDGVIVFHPLGKDHLEKIARLQLTKLKARLAERGISLSITDDLIAFLVKYGTDPKFGARPMNRAIQDTIEQRIAEKMIRGEVAPGSEVTLTSADLR